MSAVAVSEVPESEFEVDAKYIGEVLIQITDAVQIVVGASRDLAEKVANGNGTVEECQEIRFDLAEFQEALITIGTQVGHVDALVAKLGGLESENSQEE